MALTHRVEDVNQVKIFSALLKTLKLSLFTPFFEGLFGGNLNTNLPSWFVRKSSGSLYFPSPLSVDAKTLTLYTIFFISPVRFTSRVGETTVTFSTSAELIAW